MFAVIKTGGKQYRVAQGDVIAVEKLPENVGSVVNFNQVLLLGDKVGAPIIEGASVAGEVLEQFRDKKVIVFKKKRRKNYRRKNGHRQDLTMVKITGLNG